MATKVEMLEFERMLEERGYKKNDVANPYMEKYDYIKSFKSTDGSLKYQILFRFWDWSTIDRESFSFDVDIMVAVYERTDLEISYPTADIDNIEKIARKFYRFCLLNNIA